MAELTVVIPTLGRPEKLGRVLDRLDRQSAAAGSFAVIVAADAAETSIETTRALAGERGFEVRVLQAERAGASAARNLAWRSAAAALILFIDDDVLAGPGLIAAHLDWHWRYPDANAGVLGDVRWAAELRVTPFMRWLGDGIQFDYPNIAGIEAGWGRFYTANASVKRSLLELTGGFDELNLPFGNEDIELAYRMRAHGFRLLYARDAEAEHLHAMDLDFWDARVRRIAFAEHRLHQLHPEIEPYFHRLFSRASAAPTASGRGRYLTAFIGKKAPLIGERAWNSANLYYLQRLAPSFLAAWSQASSQAPGAAAAQPDLSERSVASSGGSPPSGP